MGLEENLELLYWLELLLFIELNDQKADGTIGQPVLISSGYHPDDLDTHCIGSLSSTTQYWSGDIGIGCNDGIHKCRWFISGTQSKLNLFH